MVKWFARWTFHLKVGSLSLCSVIASFIEEIPCLNNYKNVCQSFCLSIGSVGRETLLLIILPFSVRLPATTVMLGENPGMIDQGRVSSYPRESSHIHLVASRYRKIPIIIPRLIFVQKAF